DPVLGALDPGGLHPRPNLVDRQHRHPSSSRDPIATPPERSRVSGARTRIDLPVQSMFYLHLREHVEYRRRSRMTADRMKLGAWVWHIAGLLTLLAPHAGHADACVETRGGQLRGAVESRCESMQSGGRTRTYRIYVPARVARPAPVVLVLHGGGGSGSGQELVTRGGFNRIADREGIIVLYP